jgi:hypothetical protein
MERERKARRGKKERNREKEEEVYGKQDKEDRELQRKLMAIRITCIQKLKSFSS